MRHVVEPHRSIQEPLPSKQVLIGKLDGQANPAGNIKCNVFFLHGIGLIDLTQKRFDENARRTKVRVVTETADGVNKLEKTQRNHLAKT